MGSLWEPELRQQKKPHKRSQQEAHFVSRSLSRKEGERRLQWGEWCSWMNQLWSQGKTSVFRDPCLPPVSPACWMQSYRSPSLCLVWNFSRNPILLPLCPYHWKHLFLTASQTSPPPPHTHPLQCCSCAFSLYHSVSGSIALSNRDTVLFRMLLKICIFD